MKKRSHNSRSNGIDPRALDQAAALLVRAIAKAIKQLPEDRRATPEDRRATPKAANRLARRGIALMTPPSASAPAAAAPATREQIVKIAARLLTLDRACSCLTLPLGIAAAWLPLSDLAAFADRAEEHIRGLVDLFDQAIAAHPHALQERGTASTGFTTTGDLDDAKKHIARLARIANGSIGLDIGPLYLPPECRPEGFVENWPPLRDPHEAGPDPEDAGGGSDSDDDDSDER